MQTEAVTLRAALAVAITRNRRSRSYILDDQGRLRENVVIFIDARRCQANGALDDPLGPHSTVHILQALSGG